MASFVTEFIKPQAANMSFRYKSSDFDILEFVEKKILNFLKEDSELECPVILSVSPKTISKLTYFLSGLAAKPVAVGVAGETASGKSSFVHDMVETINAVYSGIGLEEKITRINADNYYYDRSKEVKEAGGISKFVENYDFDAPEAVELELLKKHIISLVSGKDTLTPKYFLDGSAVRYDSHILCKSNPVIVSEGIFNLNHKLQGVFDFCIYVNVSSDAQRERWFQRAAERDFKGELAEKAFENIMKKTKIHIKPTVSNADIVVNGEANREDYKKAAEKLLNIYMDIAKVKV